MIKKNNNNYYNNNQCDGCKDYFSEDDIDAEDGRRLCRECEQKEWKEEWYSMLWEVASWGEKWCLVGSWPVMTGSERTRTVLRSEVK